MEEEKPIKKKRGPYNKKGIDPKDAVTIEYTDKAAYHKAGDRATIHRYLAGKLEKKGIAKIIQDPAQPTKDD